MVIQRETGLTVPEEYTKRMENRECPVCGLHKSKWKRRIDWACCSTECTHKFYLKAQEKDPACWRMDVLKRDNYTCVKCGFRKKEEHIGYHSMLVADHIIPIALGGDQWDLNNGQTLCVDCDKIKTKKDLRDIAIQRRKDKHKEIGQTILVSQTLNARLLRTGV